MPEPTKPAKAPEGFQPLPSRPTTQAAGPVVFNMVPQEPRRDLLGSPIPPPEPEPPAGAWVGLVLFVLLLAGAIALLGYTFVLPFIALP